jgi:hypothetical protein
MDSPAWTLPRPFAYLAFFARSSGIGHLSFNAALLTSNLGHSYKRLTRHRSRPCAFLRELLVSPQRVAANSQFSDLPLAHPLLPSLLDLTDI